MPSKDRRADNRRYYLRNRERLCQETRERYENDTEYRERKLRNARMQHAREIAEGPKETIHRRVTTWDKPRLMRLNIEGADYLIYMHTQRQLGDRLGKSVQTMRNLEASGIIPPPIWRGKGGIRLYTEDQVAAIDRVQNYCAVHEKKVTRWKNSQFPVLLRHEYGKLKSGVDMEKYFALGREADPGVVPDYITLLVKDKRNDK